MICPYCRTENRPGAIRCAACTSWMTDRPAPREWTRVREGKFLGGVCRGLSLHFAVPVAVVRLAFLLGVLLGGWTLIIYVALWIAMPMESSSRLPPPLPRTDVPTATGPVG